MLRIRELPYDDIREVLASEELRLLNEALSERLSTPIARESNPTVTLQVVMADVCYTGLSAEQFRGLLSKDRRLIVELAVAMSNTEDLGEEYPPGEEPDEPSQVVEDLGLSRTAGVGFATFLHFVRDRTHDELMSFLEMSRTPHRAKFAKQMRAAFQEAIERIAVHSHRTDSE